jgi:hypothetical protein
VTSALSKTISPEERELNRYLLLIEGKRREIAELEADLEVLKEKFARFNAEYHARVGALFVERDRLKLETAEYRRRTELLTQDPDATEADILSQIHQQFHRQRERVYQDKQESERFQQQRVQFQREPVLSEDAVAELQRLFRELAKRFDPDLARTDGEQTERTRIMQQVNAAFHARDMAALRALISQEDVDDWGYASLSIGEKLVWAIREIARLDALQHRLVTELHQLRSCSLGVLWTRRENGEDPLSRLETEVRRQVQIATAKLADAIKTYERARAGK